MKRPIGIDRIMNCKRLRLIGDIAGFWEVKECIQNFGGEPAFFKAEKEMEG